MPQAVEPGLDSPTYVAALNALANLHRRIADRLDPPERSVCLAINADWIDSVMARRDISPDDYDTELILGKLEELWDYEHLEDKAQELIEYAHSLTEKSR